MNKFTHFDTDGNAIMVDVSNKTQTTRTAIATGKIQVNKEIITLIQQGNNKKGDVLGVAQIAGIMGAKNTSSLIPLCHPLPIQKCEIHFSIDALNSTITVTATVKTKGQTGVEMEALTAATTALLTIYDMCKAVDKGMVIQEVQLIKKTGGKSGDFIREETYHEG